MKTTYYEPARRISVMGDWDVVVCGGGAAGPAAAISAARHGARTLLVERDGHLGGTTVSALVNVILSTNGVDFQGIWHEWATELQALGGISPLHWEDRCGTRWIAGSSAPEMVKLAWDHLLRDAGVDMLHFSLAVGAIVDDGCIRGVIVESKCGRQAILAKRVIDCTGDADVCAAAGAGFDIGIEPGKQWTQGVTLNALLGGLDAPSGYLPGCARRSAGPVPMHQRGLYRFLQIDPLDPWHLTRVVREGRQRTFEQVQDMRRKAGLPPIPPIDRLQDGPYVAQTATIPGIRASRRVHGMVRCDAKDAFDLHKYPDGVARASWEIDLHEAERPQGKMFAYQGVEMDMESPEYRPRQERTENGDWFDIRYGCLVAKDVGNLLMAGRCISADVVAHASLRIQQTCMAMGQAAGTAAALSLRAGVTPDRLDTVQLTDTLASDRAAAKPFYTDSATLPSANTANTF